MSDGQTPRNPETSQGEPGQPRTGAGPHPTRRQRQAVVLCVLVILLALGSSFRVMLGEDLRAYAPLPTSSAFAPATTDRTPATLMYTLDQRFVIWVIARNARTWLRAPHRLHDAELCHPEPQSLALSEPVYTLGLLGAPIWLLTGDPLLTYNGVLFALPILSALAMFWLVRQWTGQPVPALVAALLYAFHVVKVGDPVHLYYTDTAWLVLALGCLTRWLERGGWRPAVGLAVACALQIGSGLYALLGAAFFGLPFAAFALRRHGVGRTRPVEWAMILGVSVTIGLAAFAPHLAKSAAGELTARPLRAHLPWMTLLPGSNGSPGIMLTLLAAAAFVPFERLRGKVRAGVGGGPDARRWWVLAGIALVLLFATGGNAGDRLGAMLSGTPPPPALPNPYEWLARAVPVLATVRAPVWIASTAYLGLALLSGLGVMRLLSACPARYRTLAAVVLVAATLWSLQPPSGLYTAQLQRPIDEEIAFFEALEAKGNAGPILELPSRGLGLERGTKSLTLAAYHHRPTSRCYSSFIPSSVRSAWDLGEALPDADALRALSRQGFTTLLLRHPPLAAESVALRDQLAALARSPSPPLEFIHSDGIRSAWLILPDEPTMAR